MLDLFQLAVRPTQSAARAHMFVYVLYRRVDGLNWVWVEYVTSVAWSS